MARKRALPEDYWDDDDKDDDDDDEKNTEIHVQESHVRYVKITEPMTLRQFVKFCDDNEVIIHNGEPYHVIEVVIKSQIRK